MPCFPLLAFVGLLATRALADGEKIAGSDAVKFESGRAGRTFARARHGPVAKDSPLAVRDGFVNVPEVNFRKQGGSADLAVAHERELTSP